MQSFSKTFFVPAQGTLNFLFTRIYTIKGMLYFVTVLDYRGRLYPFYMERKDGAWWVVATDALPSWVKEVERELSTAILSAVQQ